MQIQQRICGLAKIFLACAPLNQRLYQKSACFSGLSEADPSCEGYRLHLETTAKLLKLLEGILVFFPNAP